jgi:transketolase
MAATAETSARHPALALQAAILALPATPERRMADAIRALALDAIEQAGSGHPGMPMGMADAATALWARFHKFDAADPHWPDRDRFVLSAGHGAMLLYALLHLTGHDGMDIAALKSFRRLHSPASAHPGLGEHPAIEATTGPLGQGLATAVGLALAERMMAARFGRSLVDHRTWVIASDGDLMEGISHEAAGIAGHYRLEKLTVLWNDNSTSVDGGLSLASSDDPLKRFAAANWAVKRVDGHDPAQIAAALSMAMRSKKPTLIACRTIIGFTPPESVPMVARPGTTLRGGELAAAPVPLGEHRVESVAQAARAALGWEHPPFEIPAGVAERWHRAGARGAAARRAWLKRLARHPQRAEFERAISGRLPEAFHEAMAALKASFAEQRPTLATRAASRRALEALVPAIPELVGGSADLTAANLTRPVGMPALAPGSYGGRYIHWGVREHGMAAAMNGLALHGGLIPYGGTFFVFSDYMRPAIRLAALMKLRVIHVLTHDSIGLGEDGPTHQPIEHLASLRAMPNLHVFRPADAMETAECWELALRRGDGPSVLVLSRQDVPSLRADAAENRCARGGYLIAEAPGPRRATLIATGSEVAIALAARAILASEQIAVAVVSLPCWERFAQQDEAYRAQVLGGVPRFGIEAAAEFGWSRWLGPDGVFIGMAGFGASGPGEDVYRHFGITPDAIAASVRKRLG